MAEPPHDTVPVSGDRLLDAVLDAAASLIMVVTTKGELVRWNRACERLTGYSAEELGGGAALIGLILEDEQERARELLATLVGGESPVHSEFHWRTRGGELRLISWSHTALTGPDGRVTHIVGTGIDVTEERRAAEAAREAEGRLATAFQHAPIGMALADLDGRFLRVNETLCSMTGFSEAELLTRAVADLADPEDAEADEPGRVERRFVRKDGSGLWVEVHSSSVRDAQGHPTHLLVQITDMSERHHLEERLRHLADHDALTGLINRRRLEEELERHVAEGRRYGMEGALLVLDLDDFKAINDSHGHRAGDRVLTAVAGTLKHRLRETDIVARLGGDEFAVLLPRAKPAEAERVARALEQAIPQEVAAPSGARVQASVGLAPFTDDTVTIDEVLAAADASMYEAKAEARRRRLRRVD